MRIMIDTTVFLAECLLPDQKYPKVFRRIVSDHTLVFSSRQIAEIRAIMEKYFPDEGDTRISMLTADIRSCLKQRKPESWQSSRWIPIWRAHP